ncbi:hypothetical protein QYE76_018353 [Lolium multiflorum]|uniref:Reverse transcriptase domain-containing protein n=1 Tax=Lolium multiflorum TaxID=4521 RepID=A0AAD8QJ94_LOLMU|nr:hypothetical protein QYE76_018353 [Lolium multiflorum]
MIFDHFSRTPGRLPPRLLDFNWDALNPSTHPLEDLGMTFTEDEIKEALDDMPADKAPGPDGFTIAFFRSCWDISKDDLMSAINAFSELPASNFHVINTTNVVLLPKKDGAKSILDFRPISLIHVVPKIIAKDMTRRLSPKMNDIVSRSQSTFIKSRTIHDNFIRGTSRRVTAASGAENTERKELSGGQESGEIPGGEIDAIVTVIELDIISITIIIISTIIIAISSAAPRHRRSNLGLILIV